MSLLQSNRSRTPTSTTLSRLYTHLHHLDSTLRSFLLRNTRILRLAEDSFRGIALLVPGADTELRAETAGVLLSLLQIYRDAGSTKIPYYSITLPRIGVRIPLRAIMVVLAGLRAIELLIEMRAERRDARAKWGPVATVELFKMVLRLLLLHLRLQHGGNGVGDGGGGDGGGGGIVEEELPAAVEMPECTCGMNKLRGAKYIRLEKGKRTGRSVYVVDDSAAVGGSMGEEDERLKDLFEMAYERRAAWFVRMLGAEQNCPVCSRGNKKDGEDVVNGYQSMENGNGVRDTVGNREVRRMLSREGVLGEVLYIARPMLQLLLIRKYGWRAWRPWIVALLIDLLSRACTSKQRYMPEEEQQRRKLQLLLYLVRSPFYDVVIKKSLETIANGLRNIPLIGGLILSSSDLASALQTYWFYTAAS